MHFGLAISGYLALLGGACFLTLSRSWSRVLAALAVQSLGFGLVALQIAQPPIAIVKTIIGWIAATLLAVTLSKEKRISDDGETKPIAVLFRFALLLFLFASISALLPQFGDVFRNPPAGILFSSCFLIGVGLLTTGLSEHPLRSGVSLLTLLQGFELGYLWIEQSLLVLALLAVTDLAIILSLIILHTHAAPSPPEESAA